MYAKLLILLELVLEFIFWQILRFFSPLAFTSAKKLFIIPRLNYGSS